MSSPLHDLTLAQAGERLRRYRPLVLTVVLTLGALRIAPDNGPSASGGLVAAPVAAPASSPASAPTPTSSTSAPAPRAVTNPRPAGGAPAVRAPLGSASSPSSPVTGETATTPPAPPASEPVPRPTPGTVRHTGWATLDAGTPLATVGVPDESLPVANRLGQLARASFLRLDGDWTTLVLDVDPEGTSPSVEDVTLRACRITTADWEPGGAQRFEDAPRWNDDCTDGTLADGRWSFPVHRIDHPHGIALVPGADAPLDFHVALRTPRPPGADG